MEFVILVCEKEQTRRKCCFLVQRKCSIKNFKEMIPDAKQIVTILCESSGEKIF